METSETLPPSVPSTELLDRYLRNACSAAERAQIEGLCEADPRWAELLVALQQGDMQSNVGSVAIDVDTELQAFWSRRAVGGMPKSVSPLQKTRHDPRHRLWWWGTGTVLAAFLIGFVTYGTVHPAPRSQAQTYATRMGQQGRVTLPDGSTILLAPNTSLQIASGFNRTVRHVTLTGEAYFDVPHSAGLPFVVQTGRISTRVLGTRFSVQYDRWRAPVSIAVTTGRVFTMSSDTGVALSAGYTAQFTDSSVVTSHTGDLPHVTDWANGRLVFDRAPVPLVLTTLTQWYGYQFHVTDSALAKRSVSVVFKMSDATDMMMALTDVLDATMSIGGNVITLSPRHHAPVRRRDPALFPTPEMGR